MFQNLFLFIFVLSISVIVSHSIYPEHDQSHSGENSRRSLNRSKRDAFDYMLKKKGLSMAAGALIAAASVSKKKFMPVPIVFPLP